MPEPKTSKNDHRQFTLVTLDNGLECLIVHDQQAKLSAVSVAVGAGQFDDPQAYAGLAHLLEHSLFLGSKEYPDTNALQQFIGTHGGNLNAFTGLEHCNFHFDVGTENLATGLTMFADMLANPRFDREDIENEIQSIDAEFKLKLNDDLRRLYQVHKETCNPEHPFSRFSVGNIETLGHNLDELVQQLRQLHQRKFVASNMRACVISALDNKEIVKQLHSSLGQLPRGSAITPSELPPLYTAEQLAVQINIMPTKEARRLIISFALPDVHHYYRSKPLEYISHLLGDEGEGSLLVYLKAQNWATNLSAGGGIDGRNFKDFNLNLQLTAEGTQHVASIINAVFWYLELIKAGLEQSWRLQEKVALANLAFDYSEPSKPIDEATNLANQMFHYPFEDLLSGDFLIEEPNIEPIKACLAMMIPSNMRIKLITPEVATDSVAKWYFTPYRVDKLSEDWLAKLNTPTPIESLHLPQQNPYIVSSTERYEPDPEWELPQPIMTTEQGQIWFGQDNRFKLPKGDIYLSFDCTATLEGVKTAAHKRLWVAMVMEKLNQQYYRAGIAGVHHRIYTHQAGFSLHTSGFSNKQMDLCRDIFLSIHDTMDFSDVFEQIQNKHFSALQNALLNKPINRLFTRLSGIIQRYNHSPAELLPYVRDAKLADMVKVQQQLLGEYFTEGLIYGNWPSSQAKDFAQSLAEHPFTPTRGHRIKREVADLTRQHEFIHQVDSHHDDAALVYYIQSPSTDERDVAMTILVEQLLASPFFNTMRTERQLGYLVGSGYLPLNQHPGMAFYIQSPHASAKQLQLEIESFLSHFLSNIDAFIEIWQHVRNSVIKQLSDNDTSLSVKTQRLWMAIGNDDKNFDQQESLASTLKQLQFEQIFEFCQSMRQTNKFGKLILFCAGKHLKDIPRNGQFIYDIQDFKSKTCFMI